MVTTVRRSIEVEYWVVDEEGRLTEPEGLVDASPGVEREFVEPLLEVKTTPCETTTQLRAELFERVGRVLERAGALGKGLVPLATPLNAGAVRDLPSERTRVQEQVVGDDFEYVRHCAGTHIHVEQLPGRVTDQINALIALDPAFALVNSAPHFEGEYLAAGARSELYRRMAYDDVSHQGRLWRYATDTDEWTRRLERRYEEFLTAALEAGVDRRTIAANFTPETAVWTPVQLRETFGTVEYRSPDTTLPSRAVQLADDLAGVVEHLAGTGLQVGGTPGLTEDGMVVPEFETVLGHVETAIEDGLESGSLRAYLDRMGFDTDAYAPATHSLDSREKVTRTAARDLRLDHAARLERDLQQVAVGD